jgi:Planctomycete cytochrome C
MDFARRQRKLILKCALWVPVLALILAGCYWDSVEALHPLNGYTNPCDSTQLAVYSSAVKTIISYNCLSCHNSSYAGGNVSLDSYDLVKQYSESGAMMNAILRKSGTNPMPPTLALPSCQTDKLLLWINNNYPQ